MNLYPHQIEVWKDIAGYEGLYQVSNLGRIKSLRRNLIVKPYKNHTGYLMVNNYVDNLEWCTQSENVKHAYDNGLHKNKPTKLTEYDVCEIIKLRKEGVSQSTLSKQYNVSQSLISMITNNKRRKVRLYE